MHDLPPIRYESDAVPVRLEVWRSEDGFFRGRLLFGGGDGSAAQATAEIFCAGSEAELWEAVRDLREHHLRDLYRSVAGA